MAKKVVTSKKTPVSKLAGKRRIKACECVKDANGMPVSREFKAEPDFKGVCCDECFEIISFEPMIKEDDNNQSISKGDATDANPTFNNEETGRNQLGII